MTPWLAWVDQMLQRYKGTVAAWEVWNEPNLSWTPAINATDFASLAQQTVSRIRTLHPSAYIMLSGVAYLDIPFMQAVLPSVGAQINAVAYHPTASFPSRPRTSSWPTPWRSWAAWAWPYPAFTMITGAANYVAEVAQLRAMLAALGLSQLEL